MMYVATNMRCVMCVSLSLQFKRFHREIIIELEKKTEMDVKYMNVSATLCNILYPIPHLLMRDLTFPENLYNMCFNRKSALLLTLFRHLYVQCLIAHDVECLM